MKEFLIEITNKLNIPSINSLNADTKKRLLWNLGSYALIAISGIGMNIIILIFFNSIGLGYFSQVYSFYIVASQFSILGIHLSVLQAVSRYESQKNIVDQICSSGLVLTLISSLILIALVFFTKGSLANLLKSPDINTGISLILPGLFFSSINKFFLAILNGQKELVDYAKFQALRAVFIIFSLIILIILKLDQIFTPLIFSTAEFLLFIFLLGYFLAKSRIKFNNFKKLWFSHHLVFGFNAFIGNFFLEINSRVNVLILGIFAADRIVGIFSFALFMTEGFTQLTVIIRTLINPDLTKIYFEKGKTGLEDFVNKNRKIFAQILIIFGLILILVFPILANLIKKDVTESWFIFIILMVGIMISSGYLPFQMILNQTGHPKYYSIYLSIYFFINLLLNIILTSVFSIIGTAIATSISFVIQMFVLREILKRKLEIII